MIVVYCGYLKFIGYGNWPVRAQTNMARICAVIVMTTHSFKLLFNIEAPNGYIVFKQTASSLTTINTFQFTYKYTQSFYEMLYN